jgi:hypothetical protein
VHGVSTGLGTRDGDTLFRETRATTRMQRVGATSSDPLEARDGRLREEKVIKRPLVESPWLQFTSECQRF